MTVQELVELLRERIADGSLNPHAIVVRPFCFCDEESGFVEAQHLDEVIREWKSAPEVSQGQRVYQFGNSQPGERAEKTVKLG